MTTLQINDPWFDKLFQIEFQNDSKKFLEFFKKLMADRKTNESMIYSLLKEYQKGEKSIGNIAEILSSDKETVLSLLEKYEIDYIDYSWDEEKENLAKIFDKVE